MPSPALRAIRFRSPAQGSSPRGLLVVAPERPPADRDSETSRFSVDRGEQNVGGCSRASLFHLSLVRFNLHQWIKRVYRTGWFLQECNRIGVSVGLIEFALHCLPETAQTAKTVIDGARFIAAVHHAVRTLRIARFGAVVLPPGGIHKFLKGVRVTVLQQVARLLPAENVVGGHAPWRAGIIALSH